MKIARVNILIKQGFNVSLTVVCSAGCIHGQQVSIFFMVQVDEL